MKAIFIVGCGYVGMRVAQSAFAQGQPVAALTHTPEKQAHLKSMGIVPVLGDLDAPLSLKALPTQGSLLYYFAPPPAQGVTDPRLVHFLNALKPQQGPEKIVLLSTTGVYGDCNGAWIDEEQPLNPQADRAQRRVHAETTLRHWSITQQIPYTILRVAGIYGPDHLPIKRLQAGLPVLDEAISPFSNRIHVDDLVRACLAAGNERDKPNCIYNISDGHPTTMTDYFNQVAEVFNLPRPPSVNQAEAQTQLSDAMRSYLAESKRLDNWRMRNELGVIPYYPNLASGLAQCARVMAEPSNKEGRMVS
jgi:nucleoside-diphosphate-sugar epimerase